MLTKSTSIAKANQPGSLGAKWRTSPFIESGQFATSHHPSSPESGGVSLAAVELQQGKTPSESENAVKSLGEGDMAPFPNDPYFRSRVTGEFPNLPEQWHLHNIGHLRNTTDITNAKIGFTLQGWDSGLTNSRSRYDADIDAPEGWSYFRDAGIKPQETIVAVIDSGVDFLHPDLINRMWTNSGEIPGNRIDDDQNGYIDDVHGYDFVNDDGDPMDSNGHGTHVAGIIAAEHNNKIGVAGVNPHARIMAIQIFGKDGSSASDEKIIEAIEYSVKMGAKVANHSWGYNGPPDAFSERLTNAILSAGRQGQLVTIAGSNDTDNTDIAPYWPANIQASNAITVAASTALEQLSGFSNYGVTKIQVAAPGSDIISTHPRVGNPPFNVVLPGTSMAAPVVAGIASAIKSAFPALTPEQIRSRILNGVETFEAYSQVAQTGGRVNLFNALHTANDSLNSFKLTPQFGGDSLYSFLGDRTNAFEWDDNKTAEFWAGSFFTSENVALFVFDFLPFKKAVSSLSFHLKITDYESPDAVESYELIYVPDVTPDELRDRSFSEDGSVTHKLLTSGISCGTVSVDALLAENGGMASVDLPELAVTALNQHRLAGGGPVLFSLRPISTDNSGKDQYINFNPEASFLQVGLQPSSPQPTIGVTVAPVRVPEDGNKNLEFMFTRSGENSDRLLVAYTVSETIATGSSVATSQDYRILQNGVPTTSGTVQFEPGASTATLIVDPVSDRLVEVDESVKISLSPGDGYQISDQADATGWIMNDDCQISVQVKSPSIKEDGGVPLVYTFTRKGFRDQPVDVRYSISGTASVVGTVSNPADVRGIPKKPTDRLIRFAKGTDSVNLTVTAIADQRPEADEKLVISLLPGKGYNLAKANVATGLIKDDEKKPRVFSSGKSILIPDQKIAKPYPASLKVDGLTGKIVDINVSLFDVTHAFPDDLDILLVSPLGKRVMLMSDCGGSTDVVGIDLNFSMKATAFLPDSEGITAGTYRPTNHQALEETRLPAPAPAGPYGTDFSALKGTNPNGVWKLFAVDDLIGDGGSIASGWALSITTA